MQKLPCCGYMDIFYPIYICTGIRHFLNLLDADLDNSTGYNLFHIYLRDKLLFLAT